MDITPPEDLNPSLTLCSTPITHIPKRKRKRDEPLQFPPNFNESLITELKDISIKNSGPNTPEKRNLMTIVSSPIQESRKILYGSIKFVKPERKFGIIRNKHVSTQNQHLLEQILNNYVIMDVIFKHLSGGNLYRFSQVSQLCYKTLERNSEAFQRFQLYKSHYRDNKENYVITPPASPEKCDSPPRTTSVNLNKYIKASKYLNNSQSLTKCLKCQDIAVVENDISQCQNISCGLIYCLVCSSMSVTGPKDFKDACGHVVLRPKLSNMSNYMDDSSLNFSSQDSGFYSENESPPKVRRNLFSTSTETPKALSVSNKNKSHVMLTYKKKETISCVQVVPNEQITMPLDADSPPRYGYAVGSKQSKKNLKRLTR